jgi:hypothetical protein
LLRLATVFGSVRDALSFAFGMFWQILWALILGLFLSGTVQAPCARIGEPAGSGDKPGTSAR